MGSPSDSVRRRIAAFFAAYGRALVAGDLLALAACHDVPGLVLADGRSLPISSPDEVAATFVEQYRPGGLVQARPTILDAEWLSERLISADVRWDYLDADDVSVEQNGYRYVLRLDAADDPKIQLVVQVPAYAGATASTARL